MMQRTARLAVRPWLLPLLVAMAVAACTGSGADTTTTSDPPATTTSTTPDTTTTTVADVPPPPIDLSPGLMVLGAVPPQPPQEVGNIYLPDGSLDYWQLFDDGSPWSEARSNLGAFKIHSWMARVFFSDEEVIRLTDYLDRHGIPLMVEAEPLNPPTTCRHTESFEGPYEIQGAARIKALGGTVAAFVIEQPYTFGHKNDGPGSCQYSVDRVVEEVVDWVTKIRRIYPDVPIGSIEGVWQSPATQPEDMAIWLDAYEKAMGEPFAFLHMDVDWRRDDWVETVRGIEAVADERGVPFGILFNGSFVEGGSDAWIQAAIERVASYELGGGGTPDHIVFQSWEDWPDAVLPETSTSGFTHLVNRYHGTRSELTILDGAAADGVPVIEGGLYEIGGGGLAGQTIEAWATPMSGQTQDITITGKVPSGATEALILMRVNVENAGPGTVDAELYDISYTEANIETNLVPNGSFDDRGDSWAIYESTGSVQYGGGVDGDPAMILRAGDGETIQIDGGRFPTIPGSTYTFTVRMRSSWTPDTSTGGYAGIAFFRDGGEIERPSILFEPIPFAAGTATTDETGNYTITLDDAEPGSMYAVTISAPGDLTTWPAQLATIVGG